MSSTDMEIDIIRSGRKSISLEITKEGKPLVRAPYHVSIDEIERFVKSHEKWLTIHLQKVKAHNEQHPELTDQEIRELRKRAKEILPQRVAYYEAIMDLHPTSVKITSARTRFGSCSGKNGICFSLYLMQYPEEAIDYVVVHELAHIKEHNHSARFYRVIEKVLPDYKERRKLLKV